MKTEIKTTKYNTILSPNNLPIVWLGAIGNDDYWGIKRSRAVFGDGFIRANRPDCLIQSRELTGKELVDAINIVRAIEPSDQLIKAIEAFSNCYIKRKDGQYCLNWRNIDEEGNERVRFAPAEGDYHCFHQILFAFLIGGEGLELIKV